MNVIDANTTGILNFGYQGEKDRTIVRFDIADIVNAFPGGTPTLAYKAPGSNAYSPIHIEFDGTIATWVLDRTDTNKSGMGMCQLIYTNGAIVKTRKWKTYVEESVDGEDDLLTPPDWEDWKNELLQLGNTIVRAVSAYNDMDAEATALPAGSDPTARIDHTGEIPILQLGLPEPPSGGEVAVQPTEPASETNKMWINPEGNSEVQLALFSDIHSPLTKILDVTLTEDAALIVTEIDGVPLSVDELHFEVLVPSGDLPAQGAKVYCGSTQVGYTYHAAIQNISNRYWFSSWKKDGGVWVSECNDPMTTNSFVPLKRYMISSLYDHSYSFVSCITYPNITKLQLPAFPAGTRICLYAR